MTHHPERSHHPIRILHVLACLVIAVWFSGYAWKNHPARRAYRVAPLAHRSPGRSSSLPVAVPAALSKRLDLIRSILPDLVGGAGVLFLFALGTGIHARRFEIWLEAHQAGEAAAIRGLGLDQAALGANKDRKKGATL